MSPVETEAGKTSPQERLKKKANKIPLLDTLALTYIPRPGAPGKDGETVDSVVMETPVVMDASAGVSADKDDEDKEPIEQRIRCAKWETTLIEAHSKDIKSIKKYRE